MFDFLIIWENQIWLSEWLFLTKIILENNVIFKEIKYLMETGNVAGFCFEINLYKVALPNHSV